MRRPRKPIAHRRRLQLVRGGVCLIAVFDVEQPASAACRDALGLLVHSLRGRDVRWLLCAGAPLVSESRLTRVDASASREIVAHARAHELLERTNVPAHSQAAKRGSLLAIV